MTRVLGRSLVAGLAAVLVAATMMAAPAQAQARSRGTDVVSRAVNFPVANLNRTLSLCLPDGETYTVRARLVGPRSEVLGADADRINVLVHDGATGGWFWNLRRHPAYDYAGSLARQGETSLVIDRLGYDRSPLPHGTSTCLGADAEMLHQIVQHLRSGNYEFADPGNGTTPAAQHVVVHGHGLGASIAQVEEAHYRDVEGLVLMSWTDTGHSPLAVDLASRQSATCLQGAGYARFAPTAATFRNGMFATAPRGVQRTAAGLANADPCGDVLSLATNLVASRLAAAQVTPPVLLLYGDKDAYTRDAGPARQAASYLSAESVTTHVTKGTGSALPLEASAPATRTRVLRWLRGLN